MKNKQVISKLMLVLFLLIPFVLGAQTNGWGDGVNIQPSYYNSGNVDINWNLMKQQSKIETVRIEIEPDEGVSINTAKQWISEANQNGYNVIATCHNYQYNGSDDVNALLNSANWWKNNYSTLAQGGSFTVNLMNEWGSHDQTPSSFANAYNQAISIVRQVYSGPIIIDIAGWAQETQTALEASSLINDNNIVYSVHIYNSAFVQYGVSRWMTNADLDVLASAGRPVIVGEFGGNRTGGADWSALVDHAKSKGWTVIAWAWNGDGEGMNMTTPMWPSTPTSTTSYFNTVYDKLSQNNCYPTAITPYLQVNGGSWQQTNSVTVNAGDNVAFGPHPTTGGSWKWSGPNNFTSSVRAPQVVNIQLNNTGSYVATYTNSCGAQSTVPFSINVNDGAENIAINKPVTASSTESVNNKRENAVDGNASTRWSSQYSDPQWIYIDLLAQYDINRVVLNWETAYGKAYEIQVSNDASNWSGIYSISNSNGGIDDISLNGTGRYIRMYGISRATKWGYSLWEFEIYGTESDIITPSLTVSSSSISLNSSSENASINVTSNTAWSVSDNKNWISVSPGNGSNNGSFIINVNANTATSSRSGVVTVTGGGITRNINVSQDAASGGSTTTYEAENASLTNVLVVNDASASNGKYVYMQGNNGSISWIVNAPSTGTYTVKIGYNLPYGNKTQYLNVNSAYVGDILFDGSSNAWQEKAIDIALNAGSNTVTLSASWGYMYFDYLSINTSTLKASNTINSVAVKEMIGANELKVYPNPVIDILNIRGLKETSYYKVIDISGAVRIIDNKDKVDVSGLARGMYFIQIDNEKPKKIIKK